MAARGRETSRVSVSLANLALPRVSSKAKGRCRSRKSRVEERIALWPENSIWISADECPGHLLRSVMCEAELLKGVWSVKLKYASVALSDWEYTTFVYSLRSLRGRFLDTSIIRDDQETPKLPIDNRNNTNTNLYIQLKSKILRVRARGARWL